MIKSDQPLKYEKIAKEKEKGNQLLNTEKMATVKE